MLERNYVDCFTIVSTYSNEVAEISCLEKKIKSETGGKCLLKTLSLIKLIIGGGWTWRTEHYNWDRGFSSSSITWVYSMYEVTQSERISRFTSLHDWCERQASQYYAMPKMNFRYARFIDLLTHLTMTLAVRFLSRGNPISSVSQSGSVLY